MARTTKKVLAGTNNISAERIEELKEEARKQIEGELLAKQEKELLDQFLKEARIDAALDDEHDLVTFKLDLAPVQGLYLSVDSVLYYNNQEYSKPRKVYDTLRWMQAEGWRHEAEVKGKPRNEFEKERAEIARPYNNAITYASDLRRAV